MADPMQKDWQALRKVVVARVDRARADHARVRHAQAQADAAAVHADAALDEAYGAWQRQTAERFDPMLGALFARNLTDRAMDKVATDDRQRAAVADTARSAQAWHREDARRQAVDTHADAAARRIRHHAEERMLTIIADRQTRKWTGR